MRPIYLDHQATTPADPRVVAAMTPWLSRPANPHAAHAFGREAAEAVERARAQVACLVGADPEQVTFTGGATETANIALRSLPAGSRVVASAIEHACVTETLSALNDRLDVTTVDVDGEGLVDPDVFAELVQGADAAIVMAVSNEIGTVQPMSELGDICRLAGVALLTDVTQAAGRIAVDLTSWGATTAWLSSHKIYGPHGIGALIWRGEQPPDPIVTGGGQERGVRPGTVPTALAIGFGEACEIAALSMDHDGVHAGRLSERMLVALRAARPDVTVNGSMSRRVPHNLNVAFPGIDADALVESLPTVAISTGSACSAGALGVSRVLEAVAGSELAASSIRIGFGRATTADEVDRAAREILQAVDKLATGGASGGRE